MNKAVRHSFKRVKHCCSVPRASLLVISCLFLLSSCASAPEYQTGFDPKFDFDNIRSYSFLPRRDALIEDRLTTDLLMQRIEIAVENELAARDWQMADRSGSDIWVSYFVTSTIDRNLAAYRYYYGYEPCWDCATHQGEPEFDLRRDRRAAVVIDIVNPKSRKLVWRGAAIKSLKKTSPEEIKLLMKEVINRLLQDFPPGRLPVPD